MRAAAGGSHDTISTATKSANGGWMDGTNMPRKINKNSVDFLKEKKDAI